MLVTNDPPPAGRHRCSTLWRSNWRVSSALPVLCNSTYATHCMVCTVLQGLWLCAERCACQENDRATPLLNCEVETPRLPEEHRCHEVASSLQVADTSLQRGPHKPSHAASAGLKKATRVTKHTSKHGQEAIPTLCICRGPCRFNLKQPGAAQHCWKAFQQGPCCGMPSQPMLPPSPNLVRDHVCMNDLRMPLIFCRPGCALCCAQPAAWREGNRLQCSDCCMLSTAVPLGLPDIQSRLVAAGIAPITH